MKSPGIVVRTPAKLNLSFNILGSRPDGYHDVETVFQTISLEDELQVTVEEAQATELKIVCDNPIFRKLMPLDHSNLIAKAALAYLDKLNNGKNYKIHVHLEKKIPIGAGLAGGSSNAAGMLLAMNRYFACAVSQKDLFELAATLGSDVPFCLKGGTCIGRGRGELLEEIDCKLLLHYCIVKPRKLNVSTPWAFKLFDEYQAELKRPKLERLVKALKEDDIEAALASFGNVFEPVVFAQHKQLQELKEQLLAQGVWSCHMTGSGPTLFAVVAGREQGQHIRRQMLHDDELGFVYGTEEILLEALPPIDFRLAETSKTGARVVEIEGARK